MHCMLLALISHTCTLTQLSELASKVFFFKLFIKTAVVVSRKFKKTKMKEISFAECRNETTDAFSKYLLEAQRKTKRC